MTLMCIKTCVIIPEMKMDTIETKKLNRVLKDLDLDLEQENNIADDIPVTNLIISHQAFVYRNENKNVNKKVNKNLS